MLLRFIVILIEFLGRGVGTKEQHDRKGVCMGGEAL